MNQDQFDHYFQKFAAMYFMDPDTGRPLVAWPWFKAQGIAESGLNPSAVSRAGAKGVMQLMDPTASLMAKKLQWGPDVFDPKWNILAGIRYGWHLWNIFKKEQGLERLRFTLGAYNAGPGNIIKAQREAVRIGTRPDRWDSLAGVLHRITGEGNAFQTITYVKKIEKIRLQIIEN